MTETVYVFSFRRSLQQFRRWLARYWILLFLCAATIATISVFVYEMIPHTASMRVVNKWYVHTTILQENQLQHGDGWRDEFSSHPDAILSCVRRVRSHHNCNPHTHWRYNHAHKKLESYTDYDSCPDYDDYCNAQWHEWRDVDRQSVNGTHYADRWPALEAMDSLHRTRREEMYRIDFANQYFMNVDQEHYRHTEIGDHMRVRWHRSSHVVEFQ